MYSEKPHILILMPDTQRADWLDYDSRPVARIPSLERLSREGVVFKQVYSVSPVCMPARASFANGLFPHSHGMWNNYLRMPDDDVTIFHKLQEIGYYTAYIGKSHYYDLPRQKPELHLSEKEDYMHLRGIEYVHETTGPMGTLYTRSYMTDDWEKKNLLEVFRKDYEKRKREGGLWASPLSINDHLDGYVGRRAIRFIEEYQDIRPTCLFVGFPGPHPPYDPPDKYARMYSPEEMPPPIRDEKLVYEDLPAKERVKIGWGIKSDIETIGRMRALYSGKVSFIDYWIGQILRAYERKGWFNNTLVIYWSDHGDMLGDHQRFDKEVFFEGSVRVPLIMRWPGHIPEKKQSNFLVSLIDVYPTIMEAVGLEGKKNTGGNSLWSVINGTNERIHEAVFSEIFSFGKKRVMVRTDRYKYAIDETGKGYMFYDLVDDPLEQMNLIGKSGYEKIEQEHRELILMNFLSSQATIKEKEKFLR